MSKKKPKERSIEKEFLNAINTYPNFCHIHIHLHVHSVNFWKVATEGEQRSLGAKCFQIRPTKPEQNRADPGTTGRCGNKGGRKQRIKRTQNIRVAHTCAVALNMQYKQVPTLQVY
jgi:hypothetical protein